MKLHSYFRSLRFRLLMPIVSAALMAAIVVAFASSYLGSKWATDELETRFDAIKASLSRSNFPLNEIVLNSLANITQTSLASFDEEGRLLHSTLPLEREISLVFGKNAGNENLRSLSIRDPKTAKRYRGLTFPIRNYSARSDHVATIMVLFDESQIEASRQRAAILPLATGLSTIAALSSITLLMTTRLAGRIEKLQRQVQRVAAGDFESATSDGGGDEIGRLSNAVNSMASQLQRLWAQVNREQSEKLLHQIAGGMAHQLRNSLTGARMAVELHAVECKTADDEGLQVAIHQIERSEDYVRRLLLVGSGRQDEDRATELATCYNDLRNSLSPIARHLRIDVQWTFDPRIGDRCVKDGPTWTAAVTNLINNAMQAGDAVQVDVVLLDHDRVVARVCDNGSGIDPLVAERLFEPFVTSKPEGMGLGLPVVRRAAEHLQGDVRWLRSDGETLFEMTCKLMT
ncbi:MAG: HAMP domain-containing sensor histidine kinase [Pirellulaceae bacterium]